MKQDSVFMDCLGRSPTVRILNFLISGKDFDYSMTEIAEGSNAGWTSFTRAWKELEKKKAVVRTRDIRRAKLYKLNTEDPTVQKLIKLHWEIIKTETDKMLSKKKIIATS